MKFDAVRNSPDETTAEPTAETVFTCNYDGKVNAIGLLGGYPIEQVRQLFGGLSFPEPV